MIDWSNAIDWSNTLDQPIKNFSKSRNKKQVQHLKEEFEIFITALIG